MKVYKFGGGVLQDSESIESLARLIQEAYPHPLVVVVSAMGKTTQRLEEILQRRIEDRPYASQFKEIDELHQSVMDQLSDNFREDAFQALTSWHSEVVGELAASPSAADFDQIYSRVVAGGELLASKLIAYYLNGACTWLDARDYVKTNQGFCHAQVDWAATQRLVRRDFMPLLKPGRVVLTQGFIGSNKAGETTTLGKEGSDFTGAILAAALGAESLTIWKDVPGVMNADPKLFKEAIKFDQLSYETMGKMAFYGAKVVHPKTIQPLAAHHIPLYVRPFHNPDERGTVVTNGFNQVDHPVYVLQENQVLVQLRLDAFTFWDEKELQKIFHQLGKQNLRANLMERGACTLAICLDDDPYKVRLFLAGLGPRCKVSYHKQVHLLTVLYGDEHLAQPWLEHKKVLLAQQRPGVYQAVLSSESQTDEELYDC